MGTRHLYWILTGPSFVVQVRIRITCADGLIALLQYPWWIRIAAAPLTTIPITLSWLFWVKLWTKRNEEPNIMASFG
jgi:hypothetical protein